MSDNEIDVKLQRLAQFLDRHHLDGVLLQQRNNFAWITCGRDNHIANNSPVGVTAILATRDGQRVCLANTIEAPRMRGEELVGAGIDVVEFPWWDHAAAQKTTRDLIGGKKIAADVDHAGVGLPALPGDFWELRWSLTNEEITRYREGGRRASRAMEAACRKIRQGDDEHEIAGLLDHHVHREELNPVVTLIASDDRITHYRHPIAKERKADRRVMLVTCAEFGGLISCLTRFVNFGPLDAETKRKQQAVCNVDVAVNTATVPGRTLGEVFKVLQKAYAENGYADQWQLHHQGGSTGYAGREAVATPDSPLTVRDNQAFAWNPSITGVKSEDTVLVTTEGIEVLTAASTDWPRVEASYAGEAMARPDILVL